MLNYQYLYGSTSHILFTGLTENQADLLAQHANVKSAVRLSTVGQLSDPMMGQRLVKMAVTDRDYAETVLSLPTTGHLPEKAGEIALDEYTMGSLGILYEIGAPVTIQWTDPQGGIHTDTFTLCGWWSSPTNFSESCAWITAETAAGLVPGYNDENAANLTLGVTLHQPRDLEEQARQMLADQGLPEVAYTTNLAYNDARREQAFRQAGQFYAPAALVLVCGFLMIYSIVHRDGQTGSDVFRGTEGPGHDAAADSPVSCGEGLSGDASGTAAGLSHWISPESGPGGAGDYGNREPCRLFPGLAAVCPGCGIYPGHRASGVLDTHLPAVQDDAVPGRAQQRTPAEAGESEEPMG